MISDILDKIKSELPSTVKLVAVSKFHPFAAIREAYDAGQRIFAESRPQEFAAKVLELQKLRDSGAVPPDYMADICWHFIGHLQTNKLKLVLPYVSLVQSVDSLHLLEAIDSWGAANGKVTDILLECHVSSDASKQGFSSQEIAALCVSTTRYPNVRIRGVMGMATLTDNEEVIRADFRSLVTISAFVKANRGLSPNLPENVDCGEISMGMSDDYQIAVEEGSTMVRIGSLIFGARQY
ncbi:MAG: YggS family pyridoxal phosphate-dependent enzyme [Candidatus Cryptobacteroides sp.]